MNQLKVNSVRFRLVSYHLLPSPIATGFTSPCTIQCLGKRIEPPLMRNKADTERHLTTLAEKLLAIDFSRKALLEQLTTLDAESAQFQREYSLTHNDCAPIAVPPEELLSWIFELAHSMLQRESPPIELLLSQVTHRWRNIAIDALKLWFRINGMKATRLYLQRSKAIQFTLNLLTQPT